jgi:hypothetical protein
VLDRTPAGGTTTGLPLTLPLSQVAIESPPLSGVGNVASVACSLRSDVTSESTFAGSGSTSDRKKAAPRAISLAATTTSAGRKEQCLTCVGLNVRLDKRQVGRERLDLREPLSRDGLGLDQLGSEKAFLSLRCRCEDGDRVLPSVLNCPLRP